MITKPGTYYGRPTPDGPLIEAPAGRPDAVLCRRLVDFPQQLPPPGAEMGSCSECGAIVVWNPLGPHGETPRICLQCAGIQPLPFES